MTRLRVCFDWRITWFILNETYCVRCPAQGYKLTFKHIRFASKMGQIAPKWDKSVIFSDQISVHFGSPSQNVLKSDLKKSRICLICGQSDPLLAKIWEPCVSDVSCCGWSVSELFIATVSCLRSLPYFLQWTNYLFISPPFHSITSLAVLIFSLFVTRFGNYSILKTINKGQNKAWYCVANELW